MRNSQQELKVLTKKLPEAPGVYKFIGSKKEILYIGKATSLRSRVRSYFSKDILEKRSPLIAKMVEEAREIKFEKTASVLEALILESNLIKKHTPRYNSADKDQKSFNFVVITKEKFPRVLVIRERDLKAVASSATRREGEKIMHSFGPYPHSSELKEALKIVRKIFPFRDRCGLEQKRGCFNYQIGLCPGTCINAITEREYTKTITHIKTFFEGKKKKLLQDLKREMKSLAKEREFEEAEKIKKKIFALEHIQDIALIRGTSDEARDPKFRVEAYDVAHISGTNMVGVMTVIENGEVKKQDYRMFKIREQKGADDTKALGEVLTRRIKHTEWSAPNLVVVDGGVAQLNVAQKILKDIEVVAVTKDEKHRPREMRGTSNEIRNKYKNQILLANSEAHRFALKFHRKIRSFLPK